MAEYDIASFGGRPDGVYDNSQAFAAAMEAISRDGGGTLRVGEGLWRTGPFEVFSHTEIILDEGAVVSFIPEPARYRPVWTRWEGLECYAMHPCLFSTGQNEVSIKGKGVLDGGGRYWWDALKEKKRLAQDRPVTPEELELARLNGGYENQPSGGGGRRMQFLRPPLVQFHKCSKVRISGVTLRDSPFWTLHPLFCADVVISDVTIKNPPDAPNTDGIDIDSCEDVLVENCRVSVGDDGIALKSGSGADGLRLAKPCRGVTVRGCTVEDGHGGIVIGSETAGGVWGLLAEDCLFRGTDRGIRIKTRRGRGGEIRDLEFRRLVMEGNLCPVAVNMFYCCGAEDGDNFSSQEALPVGEGTPSVRNIRISDIRASGCRACAAFIAGLPESPVENIRFRCCEFSIDEKSGASPDESEMYLGLPPVTEKSIRLVNVKNPQFDEVQVVGAAAAFMYR